LSAFFEKIRQSVRSDCLSADKKAGRGGGNDRFVIGRAKNHAFGNPGIRLSVIPKKFFRFKKGWSQTGRYELQCSVWPPWKNPFFFTTLNDQTMKPQFLQVKFLTSELKTLLIPKNDVVGIVFRPVFDEDFRPVNLTAQASFVRDRGVGLDRKIIEGIPEESVNDYFEFYDEFFEFTETSRLDFVLFFRDQLKMIFSYQEKFVRLTGARIDYGSEGFILGQNFTLKGEPYSKRSERLIQPFDSGEGEVALELLNRLKRDVFRAIYNNRLLNTGGIDPEEGEEARDRLALVTDSGNSIALLGAPCPPTWD
jgi:hypothetical protein